MLRVSKGDEGHSGVVRRPWTPAFARMTPHRKSQSPLYPTRYNQLWRFGVADCAWYALEARPETTPPRGSSLSERTTRHWFRPQTITAVLLLAVGAVAAVVLVVIWPVYTDTRAVSDEYRNAMIALSADLQPEGENGWAELVAVIASIADAGGKARDAVWESDDVDADAEWRAERRAIIAELANPDRWQELQAALAYPRHVRPMSSPGLLMQEHTPWLAQSRSVARGLAVRSHLAADQGDWDTVLSCLRTAQRLGEIIGFQGPYIHVLVGKSIESLTHAVIRELLTVHHIPDETNGALVALISTPHRDNSARIIEMERLEVLDTMQYMYGSQGYVLPLADWEPSFDDPTTPGSESRATEEERSVVLAGRSRWQLATWDELISFVDQWFDGLSRCAVQPLGSRLVNWPPPDLAMLADGPRLKHIVGIPTNIEYSLDGYEWRVASRDTTLILLAIEQFEAARGHVQESLDALAPEYLPTVPIDGPAGRPFAYRLIQDNPGGRRFLLYGFGENGVDDEGRWSAVSFRGTTPVEREGDDYVWNRLPDAYFRGDAGEQ